MDQKLNNHEELKELTDCDISSQWLNPQQIYMSFIAT